MASSTNSTPLLPHDLVSEILIRLPLKSLLKFKCVSKSWNHFISTYQFSKTHLLNSTDRQRIIFNFRGNFKFSYLHSLLHEPSVDLVDIPSPFLKKSVGFVGSCDGLICLVADRKNFIFWNPSIRKHIQLPDFSADSSFGNYFTCGFGFDRCSDDYKVVVFNGNSNNLSEVMVKVYSWKTNEWRTVTNYQGRRLMDDPATFVDGKLYWIANSGWGSETRWDVVSFDLEIEEHEVLQMPSHVENGSYSRLATCNGCLYVLCSYLTRADVWMMERGDMRSQGTWSKVASVPYIDDFLTYTYKKLMYVGEDGEILLLCSTKFVFFNMKDCAFRYPEVMDSNKLFGVTTYVESLVSPIV